MSSEIDLAKALGQGGNEELVRHLLMRFSQLLPPLAEDFDWTAPAYRWVKRAYLGTELGRLEPVHAFASVDIDRLLYVERQKNLLLANTEAFVKGLPANNVLLTGARGTGKSSLIRGCASRFFDQGLRLIEVGKEDLRDLFEIVEALRSRSERFILYCDDLSFELGESGYKALKAALDGSVATGGSRILVYATSNRRHLMPEPASDNLTSKLDENGDLHPGEVLEENSLWPNVSDCGCPSIPLRKPSTCRYWIGPLKSILCPKRFEHLKNCALKRCSGQSSEGAAAVVSRCSLPSLSVLAKRSKDRELCEK